MPCTPRPRPALPRAVRARARRHVVRQHRARDGRAPRRSSDGEDGSAGRVDPELLRGARRRRERRAGADGRGGRDRSSGRGSPGRSRSSTSGCRARRSARSATSGSTRATSGASTRTARSAFVDRVRRADPPPRRERRLRGGRAGAARAPAVVEARGGRRAAPTGRAARTRSRRARRGRARRRGDLGLVRRAAAVLRGAALRRARRRAAEDARPRRSGRRSCGEAPGAAAVRPRHRAGRARAPVRIVVVGAGAIGATIAPLLARGGHDGRRRRRAPRAPRGDRARRARRRAARASRCGVAHHATLGREPPAELVVVKGVRDRGGRRGAASHLGEDAIAVTLQNGIGNEDVLAAVFGTARVVAGSTTIGAELAGPPRRVRSASTLAGRSLTSLGRRRRAPPRVRRWTSARRCAARGSPRERSTTSTVVLAQARAHGVDGPLLRAARCTVGETLEGDPRRRVLRRCSTR